MQQAIGNSQCLSLFQCTQAAEYWLYIRILTEPMSGARGPPRQRDAMLLPYLMRNSSDSLRVPRLAISLLLVGCYSE